MSRTDVISSRLRKQTAVASPPLRFYSVGIWHVALGFFVERDDVGVERLLLSGVKLQGIGRMA